MNLEGLSPEERKKVREQFEALARERHLGYAMRRTDEGVGIWLTWNARLQERCAHPLDDIFEAFPYYKTDTLKPGDLTLIRRPDIGDSFDLALEAEVVYKTILKRYQKLAGGADLHSQVPDIATYKQELGRQVARYEPRLEEPREHVRSLLSVWLYLTAERLSESGATRDERATWLVDPSFASYSIQRLNLFGEWRHGTGKSSDAEDMWTRRRLQRAWVVNRLMEKHEPLAVLYREARYLWRDLALGFREDAYQSDFDGLCQAFETPELIASSAKAGLLSYGRQILALMNEAQALDVKQAVYDAILHLVLREETEPPSEDEAISDAEDFAKKAIRQGYKSCFISHASEDLKFTSRLVADLRKAGVVCWFAPEDLKIGDEIRVAIEDAIRFYDKMLLILSTASVKSEWVKDEVEVAFEEERKRKDTVLFPIQIDDAIQRARKAWASKLRLQRQIGDFRRWQDETQYATAFDRLLRDLKAGS